MKQAEQQMHWIKTYLGQLQIEVLTAGYTRVGQDWRNDNVAPEFSVLYYIEAGEGRIRIKGDEFSPEPGQIYILPAGVVHSYSTSACNPFLKYWCHFHAKVGELHLFHLIDLPYLLQTQDREYVAGLFARLTAVSLDTDMTAPLLAKSIMFELLHYIVNQHMPTQIRLTDSKQIAKLNEIVSYIEAHISEDLTLERLAGIVNYSTNYFIAFFKSMLNLTPVQYINRARIDKAKRLLLTTDLGLSEIAAEVGMETNYFSKVFKLATNVPPGYFRNMGRIKPE